MAEDIFLEKKARGAQEPQTSSRKTAPIFESDTSTAREIMVEGSKAGMANLAKEKAESIFGIQEKSLRALVRGQRSRAASRINFL